MHTRFTPFQWVLIAGVILAALAVLGRVFGPSADTLLGQAAGGAGNGYCCAVPGSQQACTVTTAAQCASGGVFIAGTTPANQGTCQTACQFQGSQQPGQGQAPAAGGAQTETDCPPEYTLTGSTNYTFDNGVLTAPTGVAVSCPSPGAGWSQVSKTCMGNDGPQGGNVCHTEMCLWKRPTTMPLAYAITHAGHTQEPFVSDTTCNNTSPGAGYRLKARFCGWLSTGPTGCQSDYCLWEKPGVTVSQDLMLTISATDYYAINVAPPAVPCSSSPPGINYALLSEQCLISYGEGCHVYECAWQKIIKTQNCPNVSPTGGGSSSSGGNSSGGALSSSARSGSVSSSAGSAASSAGGSSARSFSSRASSSRASSSLRSGGSSSRGGSSTSAACGNGRVEGSEQCDDSNRRGGDGCSAQCAVEDGWQCLSSVPGNLGSLSDCNPFCGDGIRVGPERCDDGNRVNGDGCSAVCQIEQGFMCNATSSSSSRSGGLNPSSLFGS